MQKKAAVFILLGQSNAVGHGLKMREEDIIRIPMKNVFGLSRRLNQSYRNTRLDWQGYTSGGMNLAEEQDDTYSLANCLALLWQKHIDAGNQRNLPDLYIIQIAIGAEGITENNMWYPDRPEKLIPGKLGTVDISLFPFAKHIFSLLEQSMNERGVDYEIMGVHWRGGEEDVYASHEYLAKNLEGLYRRMLDEYGAILKDPPVVLHRLICPERMAQIDPTGGAGEKMELQNAVFEKLAREYTNVSVFDARRAPQFVEGVHCNGIFKEDAVHYTEQVNRWVSSVIFEEYLSR